MRLFDVASTAAGWLGQVAAVIARCLVQVVVVIGLGVVANDVWHLAPRSAAWLVRGWSRCRYGDTERARVRAEEVARGIDDLPGSTLKVLTAAGFVLSALPAGAVRAMRSAVANLAGLPSARRAARRRRAVAERRTGVEAHVGVEVEPGAGRTNPGGSAPAAGDDPVPSLSVGPVVRGLATGSGVLCSLGLIVVMGVGLANVGADIQLAYESGDEPDPPPAALCVQACGPTLSQDIWQLDAGSSITTTYSAEVGQDVNTLAGRLSASGGCGARIAWRIRADGKQFAQGTLEAGHGVDLTTFEVPAGRTPASLELAAHRLDRGDCTADLSWLSPGYEAPGFFPPYF